MDGTQQQPADPAASAHAAGAGEALLLPKNYNVQFDQALAGFNIPGANAFKVTDSNDAQADVFALVCSTSLPPAHGTFAGSEKG